MFSWWYFNDSFMKKVLLQRKFYNGSPEFFKFISDINTKETYLIPLEDSIETVYEKQLHIQNKLNNNIIKLMELDNDFN